MYSNGLTTEVYGAKQFRGFKSSNVQLEFLLKCLYQLQKLYTNECLMMLFPAFHGHGVEILAIISYGQG